MNLERLSKHVEQLEAEPPFHLWHPEFCGDIDLTIRTDGTWSYMGTPIGRPSLVALFARVLVFEDSEYFLKTPVEKVRIQVEDAPFVIIDWQTLETESGAAIQVTSNLGHKAILSESHPLEIDSSRDGQPRLYVTLHRNLRAMVHRNVYYQWMELGKEKACGNQTHLVLSSMGRDFSLGIL